ncbi:MAG TPA: hypothetical protein VIJ94_17995 [Caulobacteraceae bacterium]
MRQDGIIGSAARSGPWLGLFIGAAMAVIGVIAVLSYGPGRPLQPSQVDLTAPQSPAPAAPDRMG